MQTQLTAAQIAVAQMLANGETVSATATAANVSRPTIYKWAKTAEFKSYLAQLRTEKLAETQLLLQQRVDALGAKAVIALEKALEGGSATAATKAALAILTSVGALQPPEIKKALPPVEIETVGE